MNNAEIQFEREPAEVIAKIVARFSVLDLREISDADLARGEDLLEKVKKPIEILEQGEEHLIRWWRIMSNGNEYHVKRFENFCFCSCYSHFFSKKCCRHICVTTKFYCKRCQKREVQFGKMCVPCQQETSPYLKPNISRPAEKVGNIRIN